MIWIEYHPKWVNNSEKKKEMCSEITLTIILVACVIIFFEDTATMYTFFQEKLPKKPQSIHFGFSAFFFLAVQLHTL